MRYLGLFLFTWVGIALAGSDKEPPRGANEPNPDWLAAVERLRALPLPGEIKNASLAAPIGEVFDVPAENKAKLKDLSAAYDAEALKLAARWESELKALRDAHEAKMIQALPEPRRDAAKKVLDFSHQRWVTPTDREASFRKVYSERVNALREQKSKMSAEEYAEAAEKQKSWVKEERARMIQQDEDLLKQLREMLAPDDAKRLDPFNRNRPAKQN